MKDLTPDANKKGNDNSHDGWLSFMSTKGELIQTHISWVFVGDEYVYKVKKPVNFGFLDFSNLDKRKFFINEELRLNKRLCPKIYLDVSALIEKNGSFCLKNSDDAIPEGAKVIEWVLRMKRLPDDGMMKGLILKELLTEGHIELLVKKLSSFYQNALTGSWVDGYGSIDAITFNTDENFGQTRPFLGEILDKTQYDQIVSFSNDFIASNKSLFKERINEGRIREGHGDLYSANICFDGLSDAHCFDCIEFNKRFRCGDIAADVAFLLMDLDFHGLIAFGNLFISQFSAAVSDPSIHKLIDFYKCYRAFVRAKIGCFMASDPGIDSATRASSRQDAIDYLALANRYAGGFKGEKPVVLCVTGFSGTGKSNLSRRIAEHFGIRSYNSDVIRKSVILGIPPDESHIEPFGQGIYSRDISKRTYSSLLRHAAREAMLGRSVCVDATYISSEERKRLIGLEGLMPCKVVFINCVIDDNAIKERLLRREKKKGVSDGRYDIFLKQKENFSPFTEEEKKRLITIDTSQAKEVTFKRALSQLLPIMGGCF